jgi:hypothetical protein
MTAPTYTYGYDPVGSDNDRLRLMLGDTGNGSPSGTTCMFADEEISWFVAEGNGNSHLAAHHACVAAAAKYSQLADKTLGPMSIKYAGIAQSFRDQAVEEFGNATNSANVSPQPYSFTAEDGERDWEEEQEDKKVPAEFVRNMQSNDADSTSDLAGTGRTHWSF